MNFGEIIGQDNIKEQLYSLIECNNIPHAIMFVGNKGIGKLALATAFACEIIRHDIKQLNNPELETKTELMLKTLQHPDIHFSYPTIKQKSMKADYQPTSADYSKEWYNLISLSPYFTLEQWAEEMKVENQQAIITGAESDLLYKNLTLKSFMGGHKVVIMWLPERMNATSANKILKLLEEPPTQTVFLLVCQEPEKLLDTIRSRTQIFRLKGIEPQHIEKELVTKRGIDETTAKRISNIVGGSWGKALDLLSEQNENKEFLNIFIQLTRKAYSRDLKGLREWSENAANFGREKQKRLLSYMLYLVRENFIYNFHNSNLNNLTEEEEAFSKKFAPFINERNVIKFSNEFDTAIKQISQNANGKIIFFDLALKSTLMILKQ